MEQTCDISIFLARFLGLYLAIVCLAVLLHFKEFMELVRSFFENSFMIMFSGVFALIFGLLIVISHNMWVADWRVLITVIGWMALVKGLVRIYIPQSLSRFIGPRLDKLAPFLLIVLIIFFILGLFLAFKGFF